MDDRRDRDEAAPDAPVLSMPEVVVLAVLLVIGIALAGRDLDRTWAGAMLSGACAAEPAPPECTPPLRYRFNPPSPRAAAPQDR